MRRTPTIIFLLAAFVSIYWPMSVPAQSFRGNINIPKPVLKDGKFYFYGPSSSKDTLLSLKRGKAKLLAAPCNHCAGTLSATPRHSIVTSGPIILYITSQDATCGYGSGSIIVQAANGTAPYSFSCDGYPPQLTGNFPVEGSGTHYITVTDATGAMVSDSVILKDIFPGPVVLSPPFASFNTIFPTTCTSTDGVAFLQASGGTPPYTYSMDMVNFQASNVFTGLYAGFYYFYVKDANGCIGINSLIFTNKCNYGLDNISVDGYVCGNNGSITVEQTGLSTGQYTGPYQYSLDGTNYQPTGDFSGLGPGVYNMRIKDNLGDIRVFGFNEAQNCTIAIQYIAVSAACMQNDGSLSVAAANGTAPYTYTIDGINYQSSNTFTGLAQGNYFITAKDATGVTSSLQASVYDKCPVVRAVPSGETCAKNDGTVTAAGFKGTAPYQYSIDGINFQAANTFTGLAAGNYTVTIRDALGFTSTVQVTVPNSCLGLTFSTTGSTCGNSNGSLTAAATKGTAPYQFSIDGTNFQTSGTFSGLMSGTYRLTAKDANGLTASVALTIAGSPGPMENVAISPASCKEGDGSITISGTGGTAPLQYSIDGASFQGSNMFANIAAGASLKAYVKDANGCTAFQTVDMVADCPSALITVTGETCNNRNGTVTAYGSGGTVPYQFSLDGTNFQNSDFFAGLQAGTYILTVKDAIGHSSTSTATVKNICPTVTAVATTGICGPANASITATGANGTEPYGYSIDGTNFQASNVFSGLTSGAYTVTVKDAGGLTSTAQVTVTNVLGPQITAIATAASCLNNDGMVTGQATGGTSPFTYSVDGLDFQGSGRFSNLDTGAKTISVKDANGCTASASVTVPVSDDLSVDAGSDITICQGTGAKLDAASNGLSFSWSPIAGTSDPSTLDPTISPSASTKYYLTAAMGICSKTDSVNVFISPAPTADAGTDVSTCYGKNIQLSGSGGVSYAWSPATYLDDANRSDPTLIDPQQTTRYSLVVTGANGCVSVNPAAVTVNITAPAKVFAGNDTAAVINQPLQLSAADVNNSGFDSYIWSPATGLNDATIQNPIALITGDMTYTVTATTPNGCRGTGSISIKAFAVSDIFVPGAFTPNGDGHNDVLRALPVGIKEFKYFAVYSRLGQLIFYTKDAGRGWDGTLNGRLLATATFVWMAAGSSYTGKAIERKGTVVLIR